MKIKLLTSLLMMVGLVMTAPAQDGDKTPNSLDELLKMVEQGKTRELREHKEREATFQAAKGEQERLLKEAKDKLVSEERRSRRLEQQFEQNELKTVDLNQTLERRLGNLKELFGVLQEVCGDTRGLLESSITSAQHPPERVEFLTQFAQKMGTTSKLASIEEIERLWYEMQREMTDSGKVVKFNATVVTADGKEEQKEIVRVGAFNLISDGKYLDYSVATGKVVELLRQPQDRFVSTTGDLFSATSGATNFGLDPTRGSLLGLLVQSPDLRERVDQGGLVGYLILALGAFALLIALERLIVLSITGSKVNSQLKSKTPSKKNPLGRVLAVYHDNKNVDTETMELKLNEAILKETPSLGRALLLLKIISVVAPLMGLLGTVTGMITTFQAITLYGTGDPKLMAGGISTALVTTVLGLTVAIPTVLLHTLVSGRSKRIIHILEEQSAGIIAEHAEEHGHGPRAGNEASKEASSGDEPATAKA